MIIYVHLLEKDETFTHFKGYDPDGMGPDPVESFQWRSTVPAEPFDTVEVTGARDLPRDIEVTPVLEAVPHLAFAQEHPGARLQLRERIEILAGLLSDNPKDKVSYTEQFLATIDELPVVTGAALTRYVNASINAILDPGPGKSERIGRTPKHIGHWCPV